ncbi:MAG TPA: hypothetical protein VKW06_05845 [Candidatus Angelobacter sp.]|nr:hypothetical protein [Candidatus Angelobacter sp.]
MFGTLYSPAQQPSKAKPVEFQIMVNGPWAYVADPNPSRDPNPNADKHKRVVVVAPLGASHQGFVYAGVDARSGDVGKVDSGLYYLDFDNRTFAGSQAADDLPPMVYQTPPVDPAKIEAVLYQGASRLAISLPEPDYFTTYVGQYGLGLAESKVSGKHIMPSAPPREYTIWMVLHYQVTQSPASVTSNIPDPARPRARRAIDVKDNGISIVMRAAVPPVDMRCDTLSLETFAESRNLWGMVHHARFPEELDKKGTQNRGVYHYECAEDFTKEMPASPSPSAARITEIPGESQRVDERASPDGRSPGLHNASYVPGRSTNDDEDLNSQQATDAGPLLKKLGRVMTVSMGSADCHAAQMSINGALQ